MEIYSIEWHWLIRNVFQIFFLYFDSLTKILLLTLSKIVIRVLFYGKLDCFVLKMSNAYDLRMILTSLNT